MRINTNISAPSGRVKAARVRIAANNGLLFDARYTPQSTKAVNNNVSNPDIAQYAITLLVTSKNGTASGNSKLLSPPGIFLLHIKDNRIIYAPEIIPIIFEAMIISILNCPKNVRRTIKNKLFRYLMQLSD